ncbi:MAG: hypothetical protein OK452_06590 [Thaumarchaeota archaeon]|nr:hypothetical protein [Nitrososphaerota archaeon]
MTISQITEISIVIAVLTILVTTILLFYYRAGRSLTASPANGRFTTLNQYLSSVGRYIRRLNQSRSVAKSPYTLPTNESVIERPSLDTSARFEAIRDLYSRIGRNSRVAGIGLMVLSIGLLIFSVYSQYVIFEIDSVVAFAAALVLLLRDPRARVQVRVFDALMTSAHSMAEEFSESNLGFVYVPMGETVDDVVIVPNSQRSDSIGISNSNKMKLTPPGRTLAALFVREAGLPSLTTEALATNLPGILSEHFGLANSVQISEDGRKVEVTLGGASVECGCDEIQRGADGQGSIGCVVSSLLAVLYTCATGRQLTLDKCERDPETEMSRVVMSLGPRVSWGNP